MKHTMKWTSRQCLASSERVAPRAVLEVFKQVAISRDGRGTGRDMGPCKQHPLRDEPQGKCRCEIVLGGI
jgi:hypothetical protein